MNLDIHHGGMDKEDVVQIYNRILLSHKKQWNNAIYSNMGGLKRLSYQVKLGQTVEILLNLKKGYE